MLAGGAFSFYEEPDEAALGAALGDGLLERGLPDEGFAQSVLVFVEVDREGHIDFEGVDVFAELVPVERHRCFETEGVACAESGAFERRIGCVGVGVLRDEFHRHVHHLRGQDDLDAVFPGVPGAGDDELHDHEIFDGEAEAFERRDLFGEVREEFHDLRTLDRDHRGLHGAVFEFADEITPDGFEVVGDFLAVGSVDDKHKLVFTHAVDEGVVLHAAGLVADQRVSALPFLHVLDAPRAGAFEQAAGVAPFESEAPHVGDVEHAAAGADLVVLIDDGAGAVLPFVVEGHVPPGEVDHLAAVVDVVLMERCLEHGASCWEGQSIRGARRRLGGEKPGQVALSIRRTSPSLPAARTRAGLPGVGARRVSASRTARYSMRTPNDSAVRNPARSASVGSACLPASMSPRTMPTACLRCSSERLRLRDDIARESGSRTVGCPMTSMGRSSCSHIARMQASCCQSFSPKIVARGLQSAKKREQTWQTPGKCPGRKRSSSWGPSATGGSGGTGTGSSSGYTTSTAGAKTQDAPASSHPCASCSRRLG